MRTRTVPLFALLATSLAAQSNTVSGLDGRLTVIDNMSYYGRRGPAHPNGEIGMAMLNTMCNPGTVNIPWYQAMQPNHPKFGFMVVRVAEDRIEQINEWSYCKHAFLSINVNGACGSCQNPGTGQLMGLNCADTYAPSNNASRTWLGPPEEIDPWLGTWNPVGSYFDIGDPSQSGYPAPADGVRSLSQNIFDSVDNRITIDEIDLTTEGAKYYYGLQLIHEGEAIASRWDNLAHRGMTPTFVGNGWNFPNNTEAQQYGSILTRWNGASITIASNGVDDGRFYLAVKTRVNGDGTYHYEYAAHNVDNSRAGSSFRLPLAPGAVLSNISFGDIDTDLSNDWSIQQFANELVFTAPANNFHEWNTIYNFGFDANIGPDAGQATIDEARPGPGAAFVNLNTTTPTGLLQGTFEAFGDGCLGSAIAPPAACLALNGNEGFLTNQTTPFEACYEVENSGSLQISGFSLVTRSQNGSVTRTANIYAQVGGQPAATPLATTTITIGSVQDFYMATLAVPVTVNGTFYIGYDNEPSDVLSTLTGGSLGNGYLRNAGGWLSSAVIQRPGFAIHCPAPPQNIEPQIGHTGLPTLGTTYLVDMSFGLESSIAVLISGLSNTANNGTPLPALLPGTTMCDLLVATDALEAVLTTTAGTASSPITVPNTSNLIGLQAYHQWAVWDPTVNALGIVVSRGIKATVGN
ncbi:MAG: hypothetical protein ACI89X_003903 [Planctomycetota bacterium]|jgi:hypothetical protein